MDNGISEKKDSLSILKKNKPLNWLRSFHSKSIKNLKKNYLIKSLISFVHQPPTTNRQGLILDLNQASPGRKHDYQVFKESSLPKLIPKRSKVYFDSGFQGIQKDFPDLNAIIPHKRTKAYQKLTRSQKIANKKQRKIRVKIEYTICRLKKYQVLAQVCRHCLQNYTATFRFIPLESPDL